MTRWVQPAHLAPGKETYDQKKVRLRVPPGEVPGPRGSFESFTAANGVSVRVNVTWFIRLGWYFGTEVWDLKGLMKPAKSTGLYLTRDIDSPERSMHWKSPDFWKCVAAGEDHARKLVALFNGPFPVKLNPYSRVDGGFSDNAR